MVSAVAQAANNSISLYNSIIVLYLCYLYTLCPLTVLDLSLQKKGMATPRPDSGLVTKLVFLLPFWFWSGLGLWVWIDPTDFGSQPECNAATKLMVLGRELSATGSGRVVSLGE